MATTQQRTRTGTSLGRLAVAILTAGATAACEDDGAATGTTASSSPSVTMPAAPANTQEPAKPAASGADKLGKRCEQLGQACGQQDKHKKQIGDECKRAAKEQADRGCTDQVLATYDCYQKQLCAKDERIWSFDDFRVLSERHDKCTDVRKAADKCVAGTKAD